MLTVSSVLLTMLIAIPLGIFSAVKHNKWSDYLIRFLSFIGNSMPNFFAALVLMYFFFHQTWMVSGNHNGQYSFKPRSANTDTCHIYGIQVYQTGESYDP